MGLFRRKTFSNVEEAKEFLIGKISLEASVQGSPLNEDERKALNYAADEPSTEWGLRWENVRGSEFEGRQFEQEMIGYIQSAHERDKEAGADDARRFREAQEMLSDGGGTNWIVSIAEKAMGVRKGILG
jgi:hypothetical protein